MSRSKLQLATIFPRAKRIAGVFIGVWILGFGVLSSSAQPAPKINSITREWVQRGTSTELAIDGDNLSNITHFVFDDENDFEATTESSRETVRLESKESGVFANEKPNTPKHEIGRAHV